MVDSLFFEVLIPVSNQLIGQVIRLVDDQNEFFVVHRRVGGKGRRRKEKKKEKQLTKSQQAAVPPFIHYVHYFNDCFISKQILLQNMKQQNPTANENEKIEIFVTPCISVFSFQTNST